MYGGRERPLKTLKVRTQIRKSITKSNNSKLKLDFLSENFKFKLTKCKSHFDNWQFKSHQLTFHKCEFAVARTLFSILSFHFDHPPLPPPLTHRLVAWRVTARYSFSITSMSLKDFSFLYEISGSSLNISLSSGWF